MTTHGKRSPFDWHVMGGIGLFCTLTALLSVHAVAAQERAYLSELEAGIIAEHNLARTDPAAYAAILLELRPHFDGELLRLPGEVPRLTREGVAALDEAVEALRSADAVGRLQASEGLSRAARDHANDQGPGGLTGHEGTDGSRPRDRVSRHGTWQGVLGENISFGAYGAVSARNVVMQLLIDDGVPSRGHRTNIFNPLFAIVGVACGPHSRYDIMCVIDYAGGFEESR